MDQETRPLPKLGYLATWDDDIEMFRISYEEILGYGARNLFRQIDLYEVCPGCSTMSRVPPELHGSTARCCPGCGYANLGFGTLYFS